MLIFLKTSTFSFHGAKKRAGCGEGRVKMPRFSAFLSSVSLCRKLADILAEEVLANLVELCRRPLVAEGEYHTAKSEVSVYYLREDDKLLFFKPGK